MDKRNKSALSAYCLIEKTISFEFPNCFSVCDPTQLFCPKAPLLHLTSFVLQCIRNCLRLKAAWERHLVTSLKPPVWKIQIRICWNQWRRFHLQSRQKSKKERRKLLFLQKLFKMSKNKYFNSFPSYLKLNKQVVNFV